MTQAQRTWCYKIAYQLDGKMRKTAAELKSFATQQVQRGSARRYVVLDGEDLERVADHLRYVTEQDGENLGRKLSDRDKGNGPLPYFTT